MTGMLARRRGTSNPALDRAAQLWASDVRYMNESEELCSEPGRWWSGFVRLLRSSTPPQLVATLVWLADIFSSKDVLSWD